MRLFVLNTFLALQVGLALILGGCSSNLDAVRRLDPAGASFTAALAREYRDFALFEADEMYDWPDAFHFAAKALAAGRGVMTAPERPLDWSLAQPFRGPALAAHARLIRVLDGGGRERRPVVAARAQARYDCWLEQQEEGWQDQHIEDCRRAFQSALTTLEADHATLRRPDIGSDLASVPAPDQASAFALFFPFDASAPDSDGDAAIEAIVGAASRQPVTVIIDGHADRAGPAPYNRRLSARRAAAVRDALIAGGLDAKTIVVNAYGESRPRVATPNGLREARNRRVEVVVTGRPPL